MAIRIGGLFPVGYNMYLVDHGQFARVKNQIAKGVDKELEGYGAIVAGRYLNFGLWKKYC